MHGEMKGSCDPVTDSCTVGTTSGHASGLILAYSYSLYHEVGMYAGSWCLCPTY